MKKYIAIIIILVIIMHAFIHPMCKLDEKLPVLYNACEHGANVFALNFKPHCAK